MAHNNISRVGEKAKQMHFASKSALAWQGKNERKARALPFPQNNYSGRGLYPIIPVRARSFVRSSVCSSWVITTMDAASMKIIRSMFHAPCLLSPSLPRSVERRARRIDDEEGKALYLTLSTPILHRWGIMGSGVTIAIRS